MAHQYSSAPPYGAQYPPAPYYSPFTPAAGQQVSNGTPALSQHSGHTPNVQTPTTHSNTARYDANASILHQPLSMPFAPHFNPELLKHFAHHPPPPPPPGAHFVPLPGTVTGFPPFPPVNSPGHPLPQQTYPHFPQPSALPGGGSLSTQGSNPTQEQRLYGQHTPAHEQTKSNDQTHSQISPAQAAAEDIAADPVGRPLDATSNNSGLRQAPIGVSEFHTDIPKPLPMSSNGPVEQINSLTGVASTGLSDSSQHTQVNIPNMVPKQFPHSEIKERAKAALLSLVPYNIRYDSFVAEGVSARVLQQLYEELGLNWHTPESKAHKEPLPANDADVTEQPSQAGIKDNSSIATNNPAATAPISLIAKSASSATPATRPSPTINTNMERKDRIAQLLAAKAGKAGASGAQSKSQSPASTAETSQNRPVESDPQTTTSKSQSPKPNRNLAQAEIVRQRMEQLKKETLAKAKAEQEQANHAVPFQPINISSLAPAESQAQLSVALPTPVREQLAQGGLSSLIPGLFMTSAESDDIDTANSWPGRPDGGAQQNQKDSHGLHSQIETTVTSRKRSVTKVSEEDHPHAKRPIKQHKDQITVPLDENMQDDEPSDGEIIEEESTTISANASLIQDNRPTIASAQIAQANQNYMSKQTEIDSMRKRIAEIEQRQSLKRSQSYVQSPTGSGTPTPTLSFGAQALLSSPIGSTRTEDRVNQSPISLVKATPEQIAAKAAQLKADFLRQRALRQKQLQEGIPVLNDEVVKTQARAKEVKAKLAQIQSNLRQYEADILRAREDEKQLLQEIERLENQISEGESGQKRFSTELNDLKQQTPKDQTVQSASAESKVEQLLQPSMITNDQAQSSSLEAQADHSLFDHRETDVTMSGAAEQEFLSSADGSSGSFQPSPASEPASHVDQNPEVAGETFETNNQNQEIDSIPGPGSTSIANDAQPFEVAEEVEDSDEAMEESDDDSEDSHMSIDDDTNESASMSDGGSEEYEPAEPEVVQQSDEKMESEEYEPEIEGGQQYDGIAEEEADDYEPTDSYSHVETPEISSTPAPPQQFSTAAAAYEERETSNSASQNLPIEAPQISESTKDLKGDDLENGLQLSEADTLTKPQHRPSDEEADGAHVLGVTEPSSVRYVPYQSPISSFKSYRFHPSFNQQVKDGYRSLTYSHKIDPTLPICLTELEGIACSDPQCQDQHFGSMALTDDKILVQMSSANDIKEKGPRDQYLLGLKQVIARLRQEGVREFSAVADALSQYRREWLAAQGAV